MPAFVQEVGCPHLAENRLASPADLDPKQPLDKVESGHSGRINVKATGTLERTKHSAGICALTSVPLWLQGNLVTLIHLTL